MNRSFKALIESHANPADIFKILFESGQVAGKLELVRTDVQTAYDFAFALFNSNGRDLNEELPNFIENYKIASKKASTGSNLRRDMPVINDDDVRKFQSRLAKGTLDINEPFSPDRPGTNPFPQGISGDDAKKWLTGGIKKKDGDAKDDVVPVSMKSVTVKDLKPIQKQIYYDKSITQIAKFGVAASKAFMQKTNFIGSADKFIIDGHHRFLSSMLVDPNMKVNVLTINLPISELLPLSLSYGDAIGNKRNA